MRPAKCEREAGCDCLTCKHHQENVLANLQVSFLGAQYAYERAEAIAYCARTYPFMREQYMTKEAA